MPPRLLTGWICVFGAALSTAAMPAPATLTSFPVVLSPASLESQQRSGDDVRSSVAASHQTYGRALLSDDQNALMALYLDAARSLPDQQPALYGKAQIKAWNGAIHSRRRVTVYEPNIREVFDFGQTLVETGGFTIGWKLANGQSEAAEGKYLHIWERQADGTLRLKADVRNWLTAPADHQAFFVDMPKTVRPSPAQTALTTELTALNNRNAAAVKGHDLETRLSFYADDTILMPHSTTPKVGIREIRPYLTTYVANGSGATFDAVKVWTDDCQDLGSGYALEYFKFQVDWRSGESKGTVSGGGVRLWRRAPDGELKMLREIGTHDFHPSL
ncbi:DUF4440 domain-containing protein [Asticcacaulis sp. ZE23SCel15]|uniref:YybH family protein n=1 Tax=Asticcacaulis sp. ZE23SCel15 TaxID=3059027 RepID=UPI00265FDE1A|nr:DUF4440 domain-containing protein [Asticcacaulis sp. ZE23SCel15]WKL57358.1 DUF4440 domain-containing protein [Asticcacaulis sp. ZE23SCel15]